MLEIKDLMVYLDGRSDDATTIDAATRLAAAHGAHLTGVFASPPLWAEGPAVFARGEAIRDLLTRYEAEAASVRADWRVRFETAARQAQVAAEWRILREPWADSVASHARYADLALVTGLGAAGAGQGLALPETVIFASGRPVVLFPPGAGACVGSRIVVAWNASREATRAVADSMPLLRRARMVEVLAVDPQTTHDHGAEPGADIARHLARHGVRVEVRVERSAGRGTGGAILARAKDIDADLVVMGAYGHSRFTEWILGGTTRSMLRESTVPLLLSR